MRIIAGKAGSIPIKVPQSLTRPTTDRVREALFSSVTPRLEGAVVLDLYAGSGSLGLEALSRGAASVVFVEREEPACAVIAENLKKTRLPGGTVVRCSVDSYLSRVAPGTFDLVFSDPPYARDERTSADLAALLQNKTLREALRPGGLFILETLANGSFPECSFWSLEKEKKYGKTRVSFLSPAA